MGLVLLAAFTQRPPNPKRMGIEGPVFTPAFAGSTMPRPDGRRAPSTCGCGQSDGFFGNCPLALRRYRLPFPSVQRGYAMPMTLGVRRGDGAGRGCHEGYRTAQYPCRCSCGSPTDRAKGSRQPPWPQAQPQAGLGVSTLVLPCCGRACGTIRWRPTPCGLRSR